MGESTFVIDYKSCYKLVNDRETRLSEEARTIIARQLHSLLFDLYADDANDDSNPATCPRMDAKHIEYGLASTFKTAVQTAYSAMQDAVAELM